MRRHPARAAAQRSIREADAVRRQRRAALHGTRQEALEPVRQGVAERFGGVDKDAASGLGIRHDHGSRYMSRDFPNEITWLVATSSPDFVRAPEGNDCTERFVRTLKENLLWVRTFRTVEDLRLALIDFRRTYNESWLIEQHDTARQPNSDATNWTVSPCPRRRKPMSHDPGAVQIFHNAEWFDMRIERSWKPGIGYKLFFGSDMNGKVQSLGSQLLGEVHGNSVQPAFYPGAYPGAARYDHQGNFGMGWFWLFLKRRFALITTPVVIGTMIAAMVGFIRPVLHTATAEVVIEPTDTTAFGFDAEAGVTEADSATLETEMRVARSPDVTYAVISRLALERRMALQMAEPENPGATLAPVLQPFARLFELIPTDILVATGIASAVTQLDVTDTEAEARRMALEHLDKGLNVRQSSRSRIFLVAFTAENPADASRVANAVVHAYVSQQLACKVGGTTRASSYLETRLKELELQLREAEQAIKDYRADNRLLEMSGSSLSQQGLSRLSSELINVRDERKDTEGRVVYIRSLRDHGGDALGSVGEIVASPLVAILLQEHIRLTGQEAQLLSTFGERHPQVVSVRADLDGIVAQIGREADRYISSLENELSLLGARENAVQEQMDRAAVDNVRQAEATIGLRELEREADNTRNLYNNFLMRYTETREQRQVIEADARVIARAELPNRPSSPGVPLFTAVGFVASGMFVVLLGLLRERLDRGLRTNSQVESQLGLACLGQVPHLKSVIGKRTRPHNYLLNKPRSAYAEAIRTVGTFLQMSNVDDPPRVVQVTSALPGEGKTTFAISLATSLADFGHNTIVVDLDFHHPRVAKEFGLDLDACIVDCLTGSAALDQITQTTDFGLSVLPIRRTVSGPAALIGSQRMRQLIVQLKDRYEYVIVDSPPLLLVNDPKKTSALVDATLLLIRWQETASDKASNALRELDSVNAVVAGAVLTQVDMKRQQQYGYADVGSHYANYCKYYVD